MFRRIKRFAWTSTLIDIENKPDKIQVFRQNWSCDDVIYPQSRPLGSFNLYEWQKLPAIYICQTRTIIPNINRYKDLVEWLSSFNLVLLAIIKKKSFRYNYTREIRCYFIQYCISRNDNIPNNKKQQQCFCRHSIVNKILIVY